jgi:NAD(P)-dependent dehydrogenase (short-subunit alcohol dehydrogenase family)
VDLRPRLDAAGTFKRDNIVAHTRPIEGGVVARFEGKTVVVTGAGHGIGRASALRFAAEGASVAIVDIRAEEGQLVADEVARTGLNGRAYAADVADPDQVNDVVERIVADYGGIDVLHSHAGRLRAGTVAETDLEEWNRTMAVNVTSMYLMVRAVAPLMQSRGGGAIVTTGSISGLFGEPALAVYTASKAAVVNLTRSLAIDYARTGIRVNCVCPGWVDTGFNNPQFEHDGLDNEEIADLIDRTVPMGRQGLPEEMAAAAAFLASDDASYITGQILVVDGGLLCHV